MRSRLRLNDSLLGLLVSACIVLVVACVWQLSAMHAKEHGHDGPAPLFQAEPVQGAEENARREGKQGSGGGGHASFFATASVSDAVRRRRNDSDSAQ